MGVNRWFLGVLSVCCGLALSAWAADGTIQPLESIEQQVHEFVLAQYRDRAEPPEIQSRKLDPRLRLPKCGAALEAFLPDGAKLVGNTSIGVRCSGPRPWSIYQRINVRIFDRVMVASRFLTKGTVLAATDLRAERRDLSILTSGYETRPENLIGKRLRRALAAGIVISPQAVKTVPPIKEGETVTLVIRQGGMEITSSGVALSDAELGQRVRVRNETSKRVVEGTAAADHRVEVGR